MESSFDGKKFLATLSQRPGIYRMLDESGTIIYVGKAGNLKKRVASYLGSKAYHPKTQALMNRVANIEVTVTATEAEALLLEYNLIKAHEPRFNVLLRDDKSYPYIKLTKSQTYPRIELHRGKRKSANRYFGPFPSVGSVRQTLGLVQKIFKLRQCTDSYFDNRSRPCLQYQIKRCTAPCVDLINEQDYANDVVNAVNFLTGKSDVVMKDLQARMDQAAQDLEYEVAGQYRDQIAAITDVQARQVVAGNITKDADAIAAVKDRNTWCIAVLMIRNGRMLGSRNFMPRTAANTESEEVLSAFIAQHYFRQDPPREILVSNELDDQALLEAALAYQANHKVSIRHRVRGHRRRWLEMAATNAEQGLKTHRAVNSSQTRQLAALTAALALEDVPSRIECFDISHTAGRETVASCVVFGAEGALKSSYRRFNIRDVEPGDDYAAIEQAVRRRYQRMVQESATLPDLVIIDGGKGQLNKAVSVFQELQLDQIPIISVAKGQSRKAGREKIYRPGQDDAVLLEGHDPALHLIQQIRDEAHRFAITAHRQKRGKAQQTSLLESIPGLGPKRRKALLKTFGGLQGVKRAGVDDLLKVPGISRSLAEKIYNRLHGN